MSFFFPFFGQCGVFKGVRQRLIFPNKTLQTTTRQTKNIITSLSRYKKIFKLIKDEKRLLLIETALHDIGYIKAREKHSENGKLLAKEFLQGKNLDLNEVEKICEAIKNHGGKNSSDFDDKLSMCLLLADKMDFTYKRYFKADKSDAFLKNHKLIKRNKLEMNEREIKLTIVCDKKFDKDEYLNS